METMDIHCKNTKIKILPQENLWVMSWITNLPKFPPEENVSKISINPKIPPSNNPTSRQDQLLTTWSKKMAHSTSLQFTTYKPRTHPHWQNHSGDFWWKIFRSLPGSSRTKTRNKKCNQRHNLLWFKQLYIYYKGRQFDYTNNVC